MTDQTSSAQNARPAPASSEPLPRRLTRTERLAAQSAQLATQQSTLKREAAERRAARAAKADPTN